MKTKEEIAADQQEQITKAVILTLQYGQIDGAHHKMWVIDQIVRILTKNQYDAVIKVSNGDEYEWDVGIAP